MRIVIYFTGVILYILISVLTGIVAYCVFDVDEDDSYMAGIFWPLFLPIAILCLPFYLIAKILDLLL